MGTKYDVEVGRVRKNDVFGTTASTCSCAVTSCCAARRSTPSSSPRPCTSKAVAAKEKVGTWSTLGTQPCLPPPSHPRPFLGLTTACEKRARARRFGLHVV